MGGGTSCGSGIRYRNRIKPTASQRTKTSVGHQAANPRSNTNTEVEQMTSQRKTSAKAGKAASKVLRDGRTGKASKTAAGSALSQRAPKGGKRK
jgi:hypothetical protein